MEMEHFKSKVNFGPRCHEWQASLSGSGYGQFYYNNDKFMAHRKAYELYNGPIPDGVQVLHRCDNKKCVNPAHLFLGSQLDNMRDKVAKGRQLKGSQITQSVLTEPQVSDIKSMLSGGKTHSAIAEKFGVARSTISMINTGKNWSHAA